MEIEFRFEFHIIDNINGIVYNDRQMKDFLKILIHPLDIVKKGG